MRVQHMHKRLTGMHINDVPDAVHQTERYQPVSVPPTVQQGRLVSKHGANHVTITDILT